MMFWIIFMLSSLSFHLNMFFQILEKFFLWVNNSRLHLHHSTQFSFKMRPSRAQRVRRLIVEHCIYVLHFTYSHVYEQKKGFSMSNENKISCLLFPCWWLRKLLKEKIKDKEIVLRSIPTFTELLFPKKEFHKVIRYYLSMMCAEYKLRV